MREVRDMRGEGGRVCTGCRADAGKRSACAGCGFGWCGRCVKTDGEEWRCGDCGGEGEERKRAKKKKRAKAGESQSDAGGSALKRRRTKGEREVRDGHLGAGNGWSASTLTPKKRPRTRESVSRSLRAVTEREAGKMKDGGDAATSSAEKSSGKKKKGRKLAPPEDGVSTESEKPPQRAAGTAGSVPEKSSVAQPSAKAAEVTDEVIEIVDDVVKVSVSAVDREMAVQELANAARRSFSSDKANVFSPPRTRTSPASKQMPAAKTTVPLPTQTSVAAKDVAPVAAKKGTPVAAKKVTPVVAETLLPPLSKAGAPAAAKERAKEMTPVAPITVAQRTPVATRKATKAAENGTAQAPADVAAAAGDKCATPVVGAAKVSTAPAALGVATPMAKASRPAAADEVTPAATRNPRAAKVVSPAKKLQTVAAVALAVTPLKLSAHFAAAGASPSAEAPPATLVGGGVPRTCATSKQGSAAVDGVAVLVANNPQSTVATAGVAVSPEKASPGDQNVPTPKIVAPLPTTKPSSEKASGVVCKADGVEPGQEKHTLIAPSGTVATDLGATGMVGVARDSGGGEDAEQDDNAFAVAACAAFAAASAPDSVHPSSAPTSALPAKPFFLDDGPPLAPSAPEAEERSPSTLSPPAEPFTKRVGRGGELDNPPALSDLPSGENGSSLRRGDNLESLHKLQSLPGEQSLSAAAAVPGQTDGGYNGFAPRKTPLPPPAKQPVALQEPAPPLGVPRPGRRRRQRKGGPAPPVPASVNDPLFVSPGQLRHWTILNVSVGKPFHWGLFVELPHLSLFGDTVRVVHTACGIIRGVGFAKARSGRTEALRAWWLDNRTRIAFRRDTPEGPLVAPLETSLTVPPVDGAPASV